MPPASPATLLVREATAADLPALAAFGARLSRLHHRMDPHRFFVVPGMERGYAWWLGRERRNPKAVVLAAVRIGRAGRASIVGYAYGRLEPRDWNSLREACGVLIDVMVAPRVRLGGVGTALVEAMAAELARRGAPSVVLHTAAQNPAAQAFFTARGFRPTMVEMTRECSPPGRLRRRGPARRPARSARATGTATRTRERRP
jgi:ribosomal protein S18 acetylase RimI-like enzyme